MKTDFFFSFATFSYVIKVRVSDCTRTNSTQNKYTLKKKEQKRTTGWKHNNRPGKTILRLNMYDILIAAKILLFSPLKATQTRRIGCVEKKSHGLVFLCVFYVNLRILCLLFVGRRNVLAVRVSVEMMLNLKI